MRTHTPGAILDPLIGIGKMTSAPISQGIQRTVTEQTAKRLRIRPGMAGEIFTRLILDKIARHFPHLRFIILSKPLFFKKKRRRDPKTAPNG
jgi:hypothetical protein